ncbi:BLUF domain-containing protein [Hymenobacter sp. BRD128]|uniref:BLUF domain-containing protein n=1 Tax=Hymenobacter sp. BRD128 TaxID=2675878 RepID=UPI001564F854|nr:BLUF domain-containing protein [Hymenobacter sp. BRD128]QKG55249.1 BLUF domain-containing protein [Hymenobacter sp. BRD128]
MGLYHLFYHSQARLPFDQAALTALLHQARAFNREHRLSGLLLHTPDDRFFQILEGEETVVRALYYDHIVADPRHQHCRLLGPGPATSAALPTGTWASGWPTPRSCARYWPPPRPIRWCCLPRSPACAPSC